MGQCATVSERTKDTGKNIIGSYNRDSTEHDPQIKKRHSYNIIRSVQKSKDPISSCLTDDKKKYSSHCGQPVTMSYRLF